MKKINLAITGCMGRMGQQIIKSVKSDKNFKIVALTENRIITKKIFGIKPKFNTHTIVVNPKITPSICGKVFITPKLKPE